MQMVKLKPILIWILKSVLIFVGLLGTYLLVAFCCSRIEVAKEGGHPEEVEIFILSNGVHTDVVMPTRHGATDWSGIFSVEHTRSGTGDYAYVALGWGDKGFYLETPTWADLKASVAFKAAFGLSNSAIHATYYDEMHISESCRSMRISNNQYQRLCEFIKSSLDWDENGNSLWINTHAVYGNTDAFYEARGSYSLFHTCNTWANNALKACGQKACVWTIFDTGIFLLHPNP